MRILFVPVILLLMAFVIPDKKKITIWMCGDSTMSIKERKAYPETGWGMPFLYFWDSTFTIVNLAKNGRSTSSFRNEGLWQKLLDKASGGDYVFIQFGHNDEVATKKTYTTPAEFKNNLKKYIDEARVRKAIPVLFTPIGRRSFDDAGNILETHKEYSAYVKEVGEKEKVYFIDLDAKSRELYQRMGKENSELLFLQLKAGEHPNYPDGKEDNTHFNEFGARLIAQLALAEIKSLIPDLAERVVKPIVK